MSNRTYSREVVTRCPKCNNIINLREIVNVTTEIEADDTNLAKISAMEMYGVEHSRYACTECGIDMNTCDKDLFALFNEFQNLPYNIATSAATGTIGGCIGSVTPNMLDVPHEKSYSYPSMLFCNSDQEVINGLISVISETVGEDTTYEAIRLQINPIGTVNEDDEGNPVESLTHFQVMLFINDERFTNSEETYNAAVQTFINFVNLITDPIAAFGIQERERAAIKAEEERQAAEEAARLEAEKKAQEEAEAANGDATTDTTEPSVEEGVTESNTTVEPDPEEVVENETEAEETVEEETVTDEEEVIEDETDGESIVEDGSTTEPEVMEEIPNNTTTEG